MTNEIFLSVIMSCGKNKPAWQNDICRCVKLEEKRKWEKAAKINNDLSEAGGKHIPWTTYGPGKTDISRCIGKQIKGKL